MLRVDFNRIFSIFYIHNMIYKQHRLQIKKLCYAILLFASFSYAVGTIAILEIVPNGEMELKLSEYRHLTDELRTKAREALPSDYTILTRDNIMSLLPPDSDEAECLAESCAVDIGRAIGAEYVTSGLVGDFGGMFTLTVELYESISGNLLGSFVTESNDVMGLLSTIRGKAPDLFAKIPKKPLPVISLEKIVAIEPEKKIEPQVESSTKKNNTSFWVALALDVVGAGLLVYGYTQERYGIERYDQYVSLSPDASISQFNSAWEKVDDAKTARNISFVAGSIFLVAGIGVHIWF